MIKLFLYMYYPSLSRLILHVQVLARRRLYLGVYRSCMSELKTVSLNRIARENLVNYDNATIYHNDKNPGIS